jgi:hypothetical protein
LVDPSQRKRTVRIVHQRARDFAHCARTHDFEARLTFFIPFARELLKDSGQFQKIPSFNHCHTRTLLQADRASREPLEVPGLVLPPAHRFVVDRVVASWYVGTSAFLVRGSFPRSRFQATQ